MADLMDGRETDVGCGREMKEARKKMRGNRSLILLLCGC
jgi:hypothetical protein